MAYSPGEQQQQLPGPNSSTNSHCKPPPPPPLLRPLVPLLLPHRLRCYSTVPGLSGGAVATGNASGSILLNFDHDEPARSIGAGPQRQPPSPLPPQPPQPGGWEAKC